MLHPDSSYYTYSYIKNHNLYNFRYDPFLDLSDYDNKELADKQKQLRSNNHFGRLKFVGWPTWWLTPKGTGKAGGINWQIAEQEASDGTDFYWTNGGFSYSATVKHPLTAEWNEKGKYHDYPNAITPVEDYKVSSSHDNKNPLSNARDFGTYGFGGLIFSDFRHYSDPIPLNFAGTPYTVTDDEPIQRISFGGKYKSLQKISIWSPYSEATWVDFTNGTEYKTSLEKSSVWG